MEFTRSGDLKTDILSVAEILFKENGYDATTFQMISDILGITKGAITYHFKNKHHIFGSLLDDYFFTVKAYIDSFPQEYRNRYWRTCATYIFAYRTILGNPRNERLFFHKEQMFLWEATKVSTVFTIYKAIVEDFHKTFDDDELMVSVYMDLGARRRLHEEYSKQNPLLSIDRFCYYHVYLIGCLCRLDEATIKENIQLAFDFCDAHTPPCTTVFMH